jgi:hypothetical protein
LQNYRRVYEIETSKKLEENIKEILGIIGGRREDLKAGWVSWSKQLRKKVIDSQIR